jgi:Flp pilus assembly protein TadG
MATLKPRRSLKNESGNAVIEMAFTLPLLLVVVMGIFDFGLMFQRFEILTNAAREGARVGVLPGYTTNDAISRANAYLATSNITGATVTAVPASVSIGTPAVAKPAITVTVTYVYDYLWIGPILNLVGSDLGTVTLRAVSTMRSEAS